jgi:hypothetical protein
LILCKECVIQKLDTVAYCGDQDLFSPQLYNPQGQNKPHDLKKIKNKNLIILLTDFWEFKLDI